MALLDNTREGLDKSNQKKPDLSPLHKELLEDQKTGNKTELKADLDAANKTLHENGFPTDFVITGVDDKGGKQTFKTSNGEEIEVAKLTSKYAQSNLDNTQNPNKVSKDGDRVYQTNGDANPTTYTVKNGIVTKVDHGADGYYERDEEGNYHHYTSDKKEDQTAFAATMKLDESGNLTTVYADKSSKVEYQSGIDLTRDEQGRVTKTESPGKQVVREFGYEGDDVVVTTTAADGTQSGVRVKASDVSKDGDVTVHNRDGTTEIQRADGTTIKTDDGGRITDVKSADGKHEIQIIREGPDGHPTEFKQDGKTVAKFVPDGEGGKGHWVDGDGKPLAGEPKVDEKTGKVTIEYEKGGKLDINPDGSKTYHGRRSEITIDKDGHASHKVVKGDTFWAIAEDNFSRTHGGRKPSVKEIQEEMDRIAAAHNANPANKHKQIKKPYNHIPVGVEITLPEEPKKA